MISDSLISVLVPVYNVEYYIENCCRSLFEQSYQNIEYIFVDDGSPDNSINIIEKVMQDYPHRKNFIRILKHEMNRGLSAARNTAVNNAKGDYIIHVDSDDFVDKNIVQKLYDLAIQEDADISICDVYFKYKNSKKLYKNTPCVDKYDYIDLLLSRKLMFNMFGKLIKRKLIVENSIFSIEGLNQGEDFAVYPKIVYYANKCVFLNEPLYYYVQYNSNSYTKTMSNVGRNDILRAAEILLSFFTPILSNSVHERILYNLKFYNKLTLFIVSPYSLYSEIMLLYPDLFSYKCESWSFKNWIFEICVRLKLCRILYGILFLRRISKVVELGFQG